MYVKNVNSAFEVKKSLHFHARTSDIRLVATSQITLHIALLTRNTSYFTVLPLFSYLGGNRLETSNAMVRLQIISQF